MELKPTNGQGMSEIEFWAVSAISLIFSDIYS